jgi:hypothetical protein
MNVPIPGLTPFGFLLFVVMAVYQRTAFDFRQLQKTFFAKPQDTPGGKSRLPLYIGHRVFLFVSQMVRA